ncbi:MULTISPECIES: methyltransferase [unclassified Streptomyces]|uniref:methyltransferase n=1 Tax=unclassified Streptomyces TaxID=2593676 RepID=UPI000DD73211|nr:MULTISPECIES: methyltransferase [unclassified Streptomyces]QZZ32301.1 methyltransferase [Streptomyces sp. ST1015]
MPPGTSELPLTAQVLQIITAGWLAQAVSATAELGVADTLADGPRALAEIAAATDTHAPSLYRLLRAGADIGLFTEHDDKVFELTPLGDTLRTDSPASLRNFAIWTGLPAERYAWAGLADAVRTGHTAFPEVLGKSVWDYLHDHPEVLGVFDRAMTEASRQIIAPVVAAYDFGRFGTVVDAGGGRGALLAAVLASAPGARGILYDRPEVIASAGQPLRDAGVAERAELVAGDFFESVPGGADAVIFSNILHDWDDEQSRRILVNAREALAEGGHVLLVEAVLPDRPRPSPTVSLMDLDMLVVAGGQQRTAAEFAALLADAGLKLTRIVPGGHCSVVEAVRA